MNYINLHSQEKQYKTNKVNALKTTHHKKTQCNKTIKHQRQREIFKKLKGVPPMKD